LAWQLLHEFGNQFFVTPPPPFEPARPAFYSFARFENSLLDIAPRRRV
jgi:hypothetical protein